MAESLPLIHGLQPHCTLITGPASSGKSVWAETLAHQAGTAVTYLATGPELPEDRAWQQRLQRHRRRRPSDWQCLEVGLELVKALSSSTADQTVLVDSLGTWVAAGLELDDTHWNDCCLQLLQTLPHLGCRVILVGEETGWGVVPATAAGGLFRQRLGELMQRLMPLCDASWLVLHGRAIDLLAISQPIGAATPQGAP